MMFGQLQMLFIGWCSLEPSMDFVLAALRRCDRDVSPRLTRDGSVSYRGACDWRAVAHFPTSVAAMM